MALRVVSTGGVVVSAVMALRVVSTGGVVVSAVMALRVVSTGGGLADCSRTAQWSELVYFS